MIRVASIGNANVDVLLYLDELPPRGGQVEARGAERRAGGAAANFAVAAAKLGLKASFIGCVGLDEDGDWLLSKLASHGVDTSLVKRVRERTGFVVVLVEAGGERTMVAYRGANAALYEAGLEDLDYSMFDWVHASSIRPDAAAGAFKAAKRAGATTSYDPGGAVAMMGFGRLLQALEHTDVLFLNEREAQLLESSGGGPELEAVRRLVPTVVVKMGAEGAMAYRGGEAASAPAFRVEVVDTTGAGDAFDAAFCYALARGLGLRESLVFANACAALKITRRGAQSSPTLQEVLEFLALRGEAGLAQRLSRLRCSD